MNLHLRRTGGFLLLLLTWQAAFSATVCAQQPLEASNANPLRTPSRATAAPEVPPLTQPPAPRDEVAGDSTAATESAGTEGAAPATEPEVFNIKQIEDLLGRVGTLDLSEDEAAQAKQYYQDALQSTVELKQQKQTANDQSASYKVAVDEQDKQGPQRHTKEWFAKRLSLPVDHAFNLALQPFNPSTASAEFLEERLADWEDQTNRWNKRVKELEALPAIRKQFLSNALTKSQAIEQQLASIASDIGKIAEAGIASEETAARRIALIQQEAKLKAELVAIAAQREAYERAEAVYELELELAKRKAAKYTEVLGQVRNELSQRRKQAATEQVRAAEQEADRNKRLIERYESSLGELSRYNQALTKELQELLGEFDRVTTQTDSGTELNNALAATFKEFKSRFGDDAKLSQASGQLLRDQRAKLPRTAHLKVDVLRRTNQRNDISFRRFEAAQQLRDLDDLDAEVNRIVATTQSEDHAAVEPVARELLSSQVDYLNSYIESLDNLDSQLGKFISTNEQLLQNTEQFREFIAQRDLWIRSCRPLWASQLQPGRAVTSWWPFYWNPAGEALAWSLNPSNWLQMLADLRAAAYRQAPLVIMVVVAFCLLLYAQHYSRNLIALLGDQAAQKSCTDFYPSLRTLWLTGIVSLPWPLLLWAIGWLLAGPLVESEFTRAFSHSIRTAAWLLLLTEFLRQCCRANGLAEAHLGWPRASLQQLRRYLRWVPVLVVPLVFWLVGLEVQTTQPLWSASLGRILFLLVLAYTLLALWRLLITPSSTIYQTLNRGTENWLLNLHRAWRPALVALPFALGIMASLGYYYTAGQLCNRVLATAAMLLGLMTAGGLLRRWVLLSRRKLAREQARQRRAQAATEGADASLLADISDGAVDLTALSEQTRKLLRMLLLVSGVIGVVMIWQDVFPALAWLDENPLPWLSGDSPTTWGNLLRSMLVIAITYVAVRDLPSLLELFVLQHLPFDQGARYAISTLARYSLLTVGIVIAAAALGITGTSISWLVAAMGVGLGFGLQEIFANFVSGIILLFERPIRVGDIITLGDKTGVVSRIRMRATTITDWDRKEYVVPNKDLVTERLLNWTLSDQTNRIVIEVGIAYGTDTDRATQLLYDIVSNHPLILDDPAPKITFEGFGDSTLNLIVRCFLPDLDKRLDTIHELHTTINKRFEAEGIEIAFPQQDLHLRTLPPEFPPLSHSTNA